MVSVVGLRRVYNTAKESPEATVSGSIRNENDFELSAPVGESQLPVPRGTTVASAAHPTARSSRRSTVGMFLVPLTSLRQLRDGQARPLPRNGRDGPDRLLHAIVRRLHSNC